MIPLFGNDVLDCMFAPKSENGRESEEVIGEWRKLYIQGVPRVSKTFIKCTDCLLFFDVTAPSGPGPPHSRGF